MQQGAPPNPLAKRIKGILTKIDKQLEEYDAEVGGRLNMFEITDPEGRIEVKDLKRALEVIRHRPSDAAIDVLIEKLDVDHDNLVPLADIISLAEGEGLGIVVENDEVVAEITDTTERILKDAPGFASSSSSSKTDESGSGKKEKKEKKELKKEDVVSDD